MSGSFPWEDGYYVNESSGALITVVKGNNTFAQNINFIGIVEPADTMKAVWSYGTFGPTPPKAEELTGKKNFDIEMTIGGFMKSYGVLGKDKKSVTIVSFMTHEVEVLTWKSEAQFRALKLKGDHVSAPSSHYKIQPENQGKLIWLSGPPGSGKSVAAQMMSRDLGYVYYEADCFMHMLNPYIPVDVPEPSMYQFKQPSLRVCC